MNNVFKRILAFVICVLCITTSFSQITLPSKAMGKPKVFTDEQRSSEWDDVARNHQWGTLTSNYWKVYIDREGVKSYESPSSSSKVKNESLSFMSEYFVAKEQDGYLLLYSEKYGQENLTISKNAKSIGWVPASHLLLWTSCPRTDCQIYQKAVILKDLNTIQDKRDLDEVSPLFSKSPSRNLSTGIRARELEFYFVYKIVEGAALLATESKLANVNNIVSMKFGWMKRGNWTDWNQRLCYEPFFEADNQSIKAAVFNSQNEAKNYRNSGEMTSPIWTSKLPSKRWSPKMVRFPVLEVMGRTSEVGTISAFSSDGAHVPTSELQELQNKLDNIRRRIGKVNVVFVVDATNSMKNYYQAMAQAIVRAMNQNQMQGANVYFGAVVYRNYADQDVIEKCPLTSDYQSVANWLLNRQCHSVGTTHFEAMYHGLKTAIDGMSWQKDNSNFLILVGDAGNANPDSKGITMDEIAKKMKEKDISFFAFQANHPFFDAYDYFPIQIGQIQKKTYGNVHFDLDSKGTYVWKNWDKGAAKASSISIPLLSTGYSFVGVDQSEQANKVQSRIENFIVEFNNQMNDSKLLLEQIVSGSSNSENGKLDETTVTRVLKDLGLNDSEIKALNGATLKLVGHTSRVADNNDVFISSVFMARQELDELISNLHKISSVSSTNKRQSLYNALHSLMLSYVGQSQNADELSTDDFVKCMGFEAGTGMDPLAGIRIKDILDPSRVAESRINDFINIIKADVNILEKCRNDKSCYFDSENGNRYYYILMRDMPLQDHNQ